MTGGSAWPHVLDGRPLFVSKPTYLYVQPPWTAEQVCPLAQEIPGRIQRAMRTETSEGAFPKKKGYHFGDPHNKDYNILGSTLGSPYFGKLPYSPLGPLASKVD